MPSKKVNAKKKVHAKRGLAAKNSEAAREKSQASPAQGTKTPQLPAAKEAGEGPSFIKGELCPFCNKKTLTLMESEMEIPYFGRVYLFSMHCDSPECGYHKADVESADENKEPVRYTLEIGAEEDMKIRVVKSSSALIKLPHVGNIEPGEASNGYVTNVEGILMRMKKQIERVRDDQEADEEERNKAKNLVKKLTRVIWGQEKLKFILEDPNGNSAIISPKAEKAKLK